MLGPLGARLPAEKPYADKFPLSALPAAAIPRVPVTIGINWYTNFDTPVIRHFGTLVRYFVGQTANLGTVRGGHCVCVKSGNYTDPLGWWDFYNQGSEGACFQRGTLVRMADGSHKPIEEVRTLELVATAEGRVGHVLSTNARFHADGMMRLLLVGHRHLRCTPEHPILTARGYVAASELRIGDEIALTRYLPEPIEELAVGDLLEERLLRQRTATRRIGGVATIVSAPPRTIRLTPAFGRLAGLFLAEGSTTANRVAWTFGGHERETLVEETVDLIREALGVEARIQARPSGVFNVVLYGKSWRLLFEALFKGDGAYEKRLGVANGPRAYLDAVLDGWLSGDGHERRTTRQGVTVSHRLALDMYALAQGLGRRPTIRVSKAPNRRDRWDVEMATGGATTRSRQDDDTVWRKVIGVEFEEYAGFVHNLEVEGGESYVAEGIGVHNCVGFGSSRMMSLLNRKRYDARWLWDIAKTVDPWPDTNPGDDNGTSVDAAMQVLRGKGHVPWLAAYAGKTWSERDFETSVLAEGVGSYRWAASVDEVRSVLQSSLNDQLQAVPFLNSWGRDYPHVCWLPYAVFERLLNESGEVALVVDR